MPEQQYRKSGTKINTNVIHTLQLISNHFEYTLGFCRLVVNLHAFLWRVARVCLASHSNYQINYLSAGGVMDEEFVSLTRWQS